MHNKEVGVPHWRRQRISAVLLIPLCLWVLYNLVHHIGADYELALAWVQNPIVAVLLVVFIGALFYHSKLGMQVIIEDYISNLSVRNSIVRISNLICWLAMLLGILSIVKIALHL